MPTKFFIAAGFSNLRIPPSPFSFVCAPSFKEVKNLQPMIYHEHYTFNIKSEVKKYD